jgi:hypothetical protein
MIRKTDGQLFAALALAAGLFAFAQPAEAKHDSNTLHKLGKAIQYPVRKDTENISVDTHRTENRNSIESRRPQKAEAVVTPNGNQYTVGHRGYAHRRHHRRHHHHTK